MKYLIFVLPLASRYLFAEDGQAVIIWNVANKLWCTGPRPDTKYDSYNTEKCCNYAHQEFTEDGYCTGEYSHGDGWFSKFNHCCIGSNALIHAFCINGLCPSKTVNIGGISYAVNGTQSTTTTVTAPTATN